MTAPWDEPEWIDQATAWIDEHVARLGEVELMLARPWSAIVRVPTADGHVWFKENDLTTSFEPALTERLVRIRPDCLPELIAWEGPRVLTHHVGPRLRAVLDAGETQPSWETILPLYAELQIDFIRGLFADGYLLFPISRADVWLRTLDGHPAALEEHGDPVNAWLEILGELVDGTTTLGGA